MFYHFKKNQGGDIAWINDGFFVCKPNIFNYIEGDATFWEKVPLENLSRDNQLAAYKHEGFWYHMDTLRDKNYLKELWQKGKLPWKVWE